MTAALRSGKHKTALLIITFGSPVLLGIGEAPWNVVSKYHRELSGALAFITISAPARISIFILNYWPLIAKGLAGFVLPHVPLALGIRMLMIPSPSSRWPSGPTRTRSFTVAWW